MAGMLDSGLDAGGTFDSDAGGPAGTRETSVPARGRQAQHRPADDMAKGSKADATAAVRADSPSLSVDPGVSLPVLAAGAARLLGETVRAAVIAGDRDEAVAGLSGLAAGTQGPRVIG
ncbi:hypothetical protein, partial [Nocardia farcinica]